MQFFETRRDDGCARILNVFGTTKLFPPHSIVRSSAYFLTIPGGVMLSSTSFVAS